MECLKDQWTGFTAVLYWYYTARKMVGARGFEPPTPDTPCQCATRLRYAPKIQWNDGVMEYWNIGSCKKEGPFLFV